MTTPRNLSSRYELGEILGFGGMSEVHLARDVRLSRDVAIKVLRADLARDPTFYLRFRREAQNAAALNHPAIVAVYDTGEAETEAGPLPYIVMEYVDGDTLRDIVRSEGPMAPRRAMEIISDVCAALDFSHRNGIVHRDVKPANVMINRAGAVKVMDFGIARAISDASSPMTQTAAVIGTAQYLSPEQARGEQVDARSDVYSLGCVLFEILTGQPPFKGDSPVAVAYQHVREDPQTPSEINPDIPRELDSVILKAMSKNPANRYQTAADMRSDLVRVLGGQRPSAPMVMSDEDRTTILGAVDTGAGHYRRPPAPVPGPATRSEPAEPEKKNNALRMALLALAGLIVVGIVGAFLWSVGPGSEADQVTMPDVTNQNADEAETTLQNLGFRVARQQKPDAVVATGNVITTRPVGGVQVDEGSTITLEVSSGPEQVKVPRLAGLSQQEAQQELNAVGLRLDTAVARAPSSPSEIDTVIDQNPSSGASIALDSVVAITLGSGPEQIRIPDVTGQKVEVAQANIEGAGFTAVIQQIDSGQPKGEVVSTDPVGGSTAAKGDTITIRVSNGDNIAMPDLTGKTVSQALATLRSAGWSGSSSSLAQTQTSTLDPDMVGKVLTQQQPPGSEIAKDAVVSVGVGTLGIPR
ncbi:MULTISPECIES: Stk1 family PASTA domain-containing Ser/Thr kinase [Rhodococcus]|jgi:beta-lactam-binding protein with PASTA domain/predicted Ser/Thr protein kinase|uniref:non-specific serine/threonine protein kinase n=1 Tax=Rhodococcus oxybenzonivorans TaxID=1990687 RepID=A0A2S2BNT6_9NOCA|nr:MULTISPECIES: Stk1 family PASTA domain-containing Ser/Thr kinase [Rhodococcus]AWK70223.1 serine/threonine protein kinase [Rhodococcus oxybenzonivorans]MDV7246080.1 Stk1 family PASTA domain-containing Ser/Thr kinase [Rhodococcus oxybenzonivorans]MDV7266078.1 Stk1 family PASTA domain-containing Ser/Thr kinase [Rhodococcus oxybenzonivorans]MDV7277675.1 Stk1 family PASTA domain-containing Ser/Thr kinase [Rhodococcus oxybenzonivorans]MDV7337093.1 Stk1 family PASTA domain-containing Ser/Thr kinas